VVRSHPESPHKPRYYDSLQVLLKYATFKKNDNTADKRFNYKSIFLILYNQYRKKFVFERKVYIIYEKNNY